MSSTTPQEPRSVTLHDIARHCGLGVATVSRALRDLPGQRAETRARVLAAAAELGYDPSHHASARRLRLSRDGKRIINYTISVLLPENYRRCEYFARLFDGVIETVLPTRYSVVLMYVPEDMDVAIPAAVARGEVDGIIWLASLSIDSVMMQFRRNPAIARCPVVSVAIRVPGSVSVMPDLEDGGYQAAKHLLALGHRQFLYFTYPFDAPTDSRALGMQRALREQGLAPDRHLHPLSLPERWMDPEGVTPYAMQCRAYPVGHASYQRHPLVAHLRAHPEITAVLTMNDANALYAWYTVQQAGIRVPEEISIVGFDDTDPMIGPFRQNMLTSVHLPLEDMGRLATERLIAHIEGGTTEDTVIDMPVELLVRESTGPARK